MKSKHILSFCQSCGEMVKCATCDNNCCNGGHGTVDGVDCTDCLDAYDMQDMYLKDNNSVEFFGQGSLSNYEIRDLLKSKQMDEMYFANLADVKEE